MPRERFDGPVRRDREEANLRDGEDSTSDMLFTVETVNCLGACGLSPAMVINDEVYGQLTPQRVSDIIDEIVLKEAHNESDDHGLNKIGSDFIARSQAVERRSRLCGDRVPCQRLTQGLRGIHPVDKGQRAQCRRGAQEREEGIFVSRTGCQASAR